MFNPEKITPSRVFFSCVALGTCLGLLNISDPSPSMVIMSLSVPTFLGIIIGCIGGYHVGLDYIERYGLAPVRAFFICIIISLVLGLLLSWRLPNDQCLLLTACIVFLGIIVGDIGLTCLEYDMYTRYKRRIA